MERSDFLEGVHDRAKTRADRAILFAAYLVHEVGEQAPSLRSIQSMFDAASLSVPNVTNLRDMLKADRRCSVSGDTVKLKPNAKADLYSTFPELKVVEKPSAISADMALKLSRVPFLDQAYVAGLQDMLDLYAALHALENSMRALIERVLSAKLGPEWWEKSANGPQKRKHADRLEKERLRQWLPTRSSVGPLYSLDWSDLISIMRRFEGDFLHCFGEIDFLHRYADLGLLRHVVAHNGIIDDQAQRDRVFLALHDWQVQVAPKARL